MLLRTSQLHVDTWLANKATTGAVTLSPLGCKPYSTKPLDWYNTQMAQHVPDPNSILRQWDVSLHSLDNSLQLIL